MRYTLHTAHKNPKQKEVDRLSVSIKTQLSAVPVSVRGMIADTLVEWMEAINDEELLLQRIAEINADFERIGVPYSALSNQWTNRLDLEIRNKQQLVSDESGQSVKEDDNDVREVFREQTNYGRKFRQAMAHRTNRAGGISGGVSRKF